MKTSMVCLMATLAVSCATEVRLRNYTPAALSVTNASFAMNVPGGAEAVFDWDEAVHLSLSANALASVSVPLGADSVNIVTVGSDSEGNLVAVVKTEHGKWALALTGFAYGFSWGVFGLILRVIKRGAGGGIPE